MPAQKHGAPAERQPASSENLVAYTRRATLSRVPRTASFLASEIINKSPREDQQQMARAVSFLGRKILPKRV